MLRQLNNTQCLVRVGADDRHGLAEEINEVMVSYQLKVCQSSVRRGGGNADMEFLLQLVNGLCTIELVMFDWRCAAVR